MGQRIINNNEPMMDVRQKLNDNFTEVFANNLTPEERDKLLKIDVSGDGKKILANDGTYIDAPTTPILISDLINDIGYITSADIPYIPVKTTDIINDSGFITIDDVTPLIGDFITIDDVTPLIPTTPVYLSELINDEGFITIDDVPPTPTKLSELDNDVGYITLADIDGYFPSITPTPVFRDEFLDSDWSSDGLGGYVLTYTAVQHKQGTDKYVYAFVNATDPILGTHEPMGYGDYYVYDNGNIELLSDNPFKGYVSISGLNITAIVSGSSSVSSFKQQFLSSEWQPDGLGGYYIDYPASVHKQGNDKYVYAFVNSIDSINNVNDALGYGDYHISDTGDIRILSDSLFDGYVTITSLDSATPNSGVSDYTQLTNKPILNTDNTISQTVEASEIIDGTINLHKVSKTGDYNDLVNKLNPLDFMNSNLTTYSEKVIPEVSDILPINDSSDSNANKYVSIATLKDIIVNPNDKGYFPTYVDLTTAYPSGSNGWFAIVGATNTVWIWNGSTNLWEDSQISGVVSKVNGRTGDVTLDKSDVGLSNVQNVDQTDASNILTGTLTNDRLSNDVRSKVLVLHESGVPVVGASTLIVPFPFAGQINQLYAYCNNAGSTATSISLQYASSTNLNSFTTIATIILDPFERFDLTNLSPYSISSYSHMRLYFNSVGSGISDITVTATIRI